MLNRLRKRRSGVSTPENVFVFPTSNTSGVHVVPQPTVRPAGHPVSTIKITVDLSIDIGDCNQRQRSYSTPTSPHAIQVPVKSKGTERENRHQDIREQILFYDRDKPYYSFTNFSPDPVRRHQPLWRLTCNAVCKSLGYLQKESLPYKRALISGYEGEPSPKLPRPRLIRLYSSLTIVRDLLNTSEPFRSIPGMHLLRPSA